jgi:hypothetical protein
MRRRHGQLQLREALGRCSMELRNSVACRPRQRGPWPMFNGTLKLCCLSPTPARPASIVRSNYATAAQCSETSPTTRAREALGHPLFNGTLQICCQSHWGEALGRCSMEFCNCVACHPRPRGPRPLFNRISATAVQRSEMSLITNAREALGH